MRKFVILMLGFLVLLAVHASAATIKDHEPLGSQTPAQTEVVRSPASPTGYVTTFRLYAPDATRVRIRGEWSFSSARYSSAYTSQNVSINGYRDGMFPLQIDQNDWPAFDMTKDEATGIWSYSAMLPCGTWSYRFYVGGAADAALTDYEGAAMMTDPNNPPAQRNAGDQNNSQIYVPHWPDGIGADFSVQAPRTDEKTGSLLYLFYDMPVAGSDARQPQPFAVYLPYGYDAERAEPYPVLYASHGDGVESETSWWNKGSMGKIMDNLIADYAVEPFVVVMTNNYLDGFDYVNFLENIAPSAEAQLNIRSDAAGRGLCGISRGAILSKNTLLNAGEQFGYYGIFSGAYFSDSDETFQYDAIESAHIYLGSGNAEMGLLAIQRTAQKLSECGKKDFQVHLVTGGHNWFVWRQIYVDFVLNCLWK